MRRYRTLVISVVGLITVLGGYLIYGNLNNNLVYYLAPKEAIAQKVMLQDGERFRLAGIVEKGTVVTTRNGADFIVEADNARVQVIYTGSPSQLFSAGVGVVVEGAWRGDRFVSDTMMIKHDSEYTPPPTDTGKAPK